MSAQSECVTACETIRKMLCAARQTTRVSGCATPPQPSPRVYSWDTPSIFHLYLTVSLTSRCILLSIHI